MILACLVVHTVLDFLDQRHQAVHSQLPLRTTFFEHLRTWAQYRPRNDSNALFAFMLENLKQAPRKASDQIDTGWSQMWKCFRASDAMVNAGAAVQAQIGEVPRPLAG